MTASSPLSLIKTIFIPAVISLILFLLLTLVIIPIWRRYRNRYSQYLPVPTYASGLSNLVRQRFSMLTQPSMWTRNGHLMHNADADADEFLEDGEELGSVDPQIMDAIRQAIFRGDDHTRRLSRHLEEGFVDDSDQDQPQR